MTEQNRNARFTFSPDQPRKLAGVATSIRRPPTASTQDKHWTPTSTVATRSLLGLYEADFDAEGASCP